MAIEPRDARVLICDDLHPAALEVFREAGIEPEVRTGLSEEELTRAAADVHALVVRSATKVTRNVFEAAGSLQVVGRAGIGVDNVDCQAATERGVVVMNTPSGNATTTAELALSLIFALARHLPRATRRTREGKWTKKGLMGTELAGKTLGVVGLGRIGRIVADRAQGLAMKVVAYDPYVRQSGASPVAGVELLDLPELFAAADFVSVHVPLTDATRHLVSWEILAKAKPGMRLVNASRGGVVDEEAVVDALEEGRLAGAAFDVLEQEPPAPDHPLLRREDVIVTPHLGASSQEAQRQVAVDIAHQIAAFLTQGVAKNAINAPPMDAERMQRLAPFMLLAEKQGSFLAQRVAEPIRKLELSFGGDLTPEDSAHLRLALIVGLMRESQGGHVNFVNAENHARELGLRVLESRTEGAYFSQGQIKVRASSRAGGRTHVVTGTVFGREPRFVRVDDVHLDLPPRGSILITRHGDRPGVLGQLGTVLGEAGVNIERLELGPHEDSESNQAAGFLSLDRTPEEAVLERLRALEVMDEVQLIQL